MPNPRTLLTGLVVGESPRWHEGRLWFSNWGTSQIVAVDLDGNSQVVGQGPDGLGWATNWLPDGRLLITGQELIRVEPDGSGALTARGVAPEAIGAVAAEHRVVLTELVAVSRSLEDAFFELTGGEE